MADTNIIQVNEYQFHNKKLTQITNQIFKQGLTIRKAYAKIAVNMCIIEESKCYELDFDSVHDYADKVLGLKKSQSYALLKVGREFIDRKTLESVLPHEIGADYSHTQLQALLPLKSVETAQRLAEKGEINPTMSVKDIKSVVDNYIHPKSESEDNEQLEDNNNDNDELVNMYDSVKFDLRSVITLAIDNETSKPVFIYGDVIMTLEQTIDVVKDWASNQ